MKARLHTLSDGGESFEVSLLEAAAPSRSVLFAVGSGGNPERHLPLLEALVERGCTVVAPHFDRLTLKPSDSDLLLRARRLALAVDLVARPDLPLAGVGHSIGATMLLALAGARVWMRYGGPPLAIEVEQRFDRLALLAAPTGFFRGPGALDAVTTSIAAWAGTQDDMTPPSQAEFLQSALVGRAPVELHVIEGAGHFSFMHALPPQRSDPHPDRDAFLAELTTAVSRFVVGSP